MFMLVVMTTVYFSSNDTAISATLSAVKTVLRYCSDSVYKIPSSSFGGRVVHSSKQMNYVKSRYINGKKRL